MRGISRELGNIAGVTDRGCGLVRLAGVARFGEPGPGIGGGHIDDADTIRGFGGSIPNRAGGLAALDTAPEFPLGGDDEVLVEGIGVGGDLDPFAAASDHGQNG